MSLANYSDLQSGVLSWLNRDSTNTPVTDFIALGEAELNSRVRVRQNTTTTTLTLSSGSSSVSLPSDFLEDIELNYAASSDLLNKWPHEDIDRSIGDTTTDKPVGYVITGSTIQFNCVSDATYTLTLRYYEKWDIAADSTNWLLTNHPDAYLFGALAEANAWLGDMGQAQYCIGRRDAAIQRALTADSRTRGGTLRMDAALVRPAGWNILTDR